MTMMRITPRNPTCRRIASSKSPCDMAIQGIELRLHVVTHAEAHERNASEVGHEEVGVHISRSPVGPAHFAGPGVAAAYARRPKDAPVLVALHYLVLDVSARRVALILEPGRERPGPSEGYLLVLCCACVVRAPRTGRVVDIEVR